MRYGIKKKILFIGSTNAIQGRGRYESLKEIYGFENIDFFDANYYAFKNFNKFLLAAWGKFGGSKFLDKHIRDYLQNKYKESNYLLVWIECPEYFGTLSLEFLREISDNIHLYGIDNPFYKQGKKRYKLFLKAKDFYTSMIFFRESSVITALELTNANVRREFQCYPKFLYEYAQQLSTKNASDINFYRPGAVFIGTNIPNNNRLGLLKKVSRNIPSLDIYGNKWPMKSLCFPCQLMKKEVINEDYIQAIQSKSTNIVLLNKENLDLCTLRSVEIPAFGGLALYPNTSDHKIILGEDLEILIFSSINELINKINLFSIDRCLANEIRNLLKNRIKKLKLSSTDSIKRQINNLSIKGLEIQ